MIDEVENMNMSLRNQAYETAWEHAHKQRYIEQYAQLLVVWTSPNLQRSP